MDKMGKKLTDRDLINRLIAWYKLDQSTEQLREAVGAYIRQDATVRETTSDAISHEVQTSLSEDQAPALEDLGAIRNGSKLQHADIGPKFSGVKYEPQFEPTDEIIGSRRWTIDTWALYYGTEDFFQRISFGLLNMRSLAALFCILVSVAVIIGAWQSNLSSERLKTATFKSMVIEPADKLRTAPSFADSEPEEKEADSLDDSSAPTEQSSNAQATSTIATSSETEAPSPETQVNTPEAAETDAQPRETLAASPVTEATAPELVATSPELIAPTAESEAATPSAYESELKEFDSALSLMDLRSWKEALAELQKLEKSGGRELQPLLTLLQVEALIEIHDMESARQLLMKCKYGEYDVLFDLIVARWILLANPEERRGFMNASASLPESARRRMYAWAQISNKNKDAKTEIELESVASRGESYVCDLLFISSFHFNVGKNDETIRELRETRQKLDVLQTAAKNKVAGWLLETVRQQLTIRVDLILEAVGKQRRSQIN